MGEHAPLFDGALRAYLAPAVLIAGVSFSIAVVLRLWTGRRRFGRRNFAGVEEFDGYGQAVGKRLLEGFVGLVMALFLLLFALSAAAALFIGLLG